MRSPFVPRRLRRLVVLSAALVAAAAVIVVVGNGCMKHRADAYLYPAGADVPHRTYAIVLGAMVHGSQPSDALADRLEVARRLYAAETVERVFVSGDGTHDEDGVMAAWLVARGVPPDRIARDPRGFRTRDTMENAAALGIRDAIVCTQAFHLPRSIAWAREVGLDAIGVDADYRAYAPHLRDTLREAVARTVAMAEIWRR